MLLRQANMMQATICTTPGPTLSSSLYIPSEGPVGSHYPQVWHPPTYTIPSYPIHRVTMQANALYAKQGLGQVFIFFLGGRWV